MDAESGEVRWIDASSRKVRERYAQWYQDNYQHFRNSFLRSGADMVSIQTDEPYVNALMKFFQKRANV